MTRPVLNLKREEIARIIDPKVFELVVYYDTLTYRGSEDLSDNEKRAATIKAYPSIGTDLIVAFAKADAILALLTVVEGELSSSVAESGGTASPKSDSDGGH